MSTPACHYPAGVRTCFGLVLVSPAPVYVGDLRPNEKEQPGIFILWPVPGSGLSGHAAAGKGVIADALRKRLFAARVGAGPVRDPLLPPALFSSCSFSWS